MISERINNLIQNLKHLPGVYLMHDENDTIIYVGKAKDLYKRVSQYFYRPQVGKVAKMVMNVAYFETIITANEKEALVLEMNLIQTHYPKYNILLKDGSHYPYIALSKKGDPYLVIKRNNKDKKNYDYFGPYPNSTAAYSLISLLNKIFPIRKCTNMAHQTCLYYHLGTCLAPCVNKIDESIYSSIREDIKSFISGNNQKQKNEIKEKMLKASENLEFEMANEYKKVLEAIDHINIQQNVEMKDKVDRDIFAFAYRDGYLALAVLLYRKGILLGKQVFTVEEFDEHEIQVADLISQFYQKQPTPQEIIINNETVISYLDGLLDCSISSVSKGKLLELVISAKENASNALDEYFLSAKLDSNKLELLEELGNIIHIPTPLHIELFDNSHIQGSSPVGAMVAFINGEPAKKLYRKFKIEHEEARDDLKSMEEIVYRHYARLKKEEKKLPDLILVDGGDRQIRSALTALDKAEVTISVYGLVKNDKHQTNGLIDKEGNLYPIENKSIFFLLTRMQDEVHRFAISFHQEKRKKAMTSSLFDDVKGLGEKSKEKLYRAYQDINLLKNASLEELEQILPKATALALYNKIHFNL
ncbi:MAG: excinuclease ABC subunit UvrC [Bacilli bacterium]|nr:excinuclease ABC subunit UvrC [Bacilli bacterium]